MSSVAPGRVSGLKVRGRRISLFLSSLAGGGAERVMLLLARGFVESGFRVDLVLTRAQGPYLGDVAPKVRVVDLGARRILSSLPRLTRYLRRERPPVLLSFLSPTNCVALWARRLARVDTRVVISEHNTVSEARAHGGDPRLRVLPKLMSWTYPRADALTAVSAGVAEDVARVAGMQGGQTHVIENPVVNSSLERLAAEPVVHPWFRPGQPPVILGAGRLIPQKDFPTLFRAFALVRKRMAARLMVVGEGEGRGSLKELARLLEIEGDLSLPGFIENPYAYMARSRVFALSSRWEGLPMALIEAMACGTRVVSTDCRSGPCEILEGGRWGRLVPVGDEEALADALVEALESPGPDPRERAAYFSVDRAVEKYLAILFPDGSGHE